MQVAVVAGARPNEACIQTTYVTSKPGPSFFSPTTMEVEAQSPEYHAKFNFEDGNIILSASGKIKDERDRWKEIDKSYYFRVHKSILKTHSGQTLSRMQQASAHRIFIRRNVCRHAGGRVGCWGRPSQRAATGSAAGRAEGSNYPNGSDLLCRVSRSRI